MALEAAPNFSPHLPEESLEKYAFGRLPAGELEAVEQHLLVCEHCRQRLETEDNFAEAMRALAQTPTLADPQPGASSVGAYVKARMFQASRFPAFAIALAAILIVGLAAWRLAFASKAGASAQPVALAALRGGEQSMTHATAGRALDLSIDLQAIAEPSTIAGDYRLELVNSAGRPLWTGNAPATAGKLGARMGQRLAAGMYWVRLYSPAGKLLREFGLQID